MNDNDHRYTDSELYALLDRAKQAMANMRPDDVRRMQEQQRLSFAYGNVAIDNPNVTREMVLEAAVRMALEDSALRATYRHVARGTSYVVERVAKAQASTGPIHDNDRVYVYVDPETNAAYVRKVDEFHDGRFELVGRSKEEGA